jgi:hypothetical protein
MHTRRENRTADKVYFLHRWFTRTDKTIQTPSVWFPKNGCKLETKSAHHSQNDGTERDVVLGESTFGWRDVGDGLA